MENETSLNHETPSDAKRMLADGALAWWNSMAFEEQFYKTIAWLKDQNRNTTESHPHNLTIDEIVEVRAFCNQLIQIMTKEEAIKAMQDGKKVKHRFFTTGEYIYMKEGCIYDENDLLQRDFWQIRLTHYWFQNWTII